MKASTIITIMGVLEKQEETLAEMQKEAREEKDIAMNAFYCREDVQAMDDEKQYSMAKDIPEYKLFYSISDELCSVRNALDDFANHDFH